MHDKTLIVDLGAPGRIADLPEIARGFLAWWKGELIATTPWRSAQTPARQKRSVTLYLRPGVWFLKPPSAAQDPLTLDTNASDGELANEILRAGADLSLSRLTLLLPRDHVLMSRLELPQMTQARMREAVELQIDRLSPFKADAVRFSAKVAARDIVQGAMQVDVAIAPLVRLAPIERRLRTLGFTPAGIDVEGEDGNPRGFDLREPPSAQELRSRKNLNVGLALAAALLWALALFAWNQAGARDLQSWEARIAELRPAAEKAAALRRRIEAMIAPVTMANVHEPTLALDILGELTKLLPDTVRVVDLRVEGGDILLSGLGANAPALIGVLENSARFKDVKFVAPVVRKPDSDIERFEMSMHLEGVRRP